MHYLIYKITNLINNKIYIGAHSTENIEDGYMGSGVFIKQAIQKYGIENFKKDILHDFESKEEMYSKEKDLVNEAFIGRKDTYNAKVGGSGGYSSTNKDEWKSNLSKAQIKRFANGAIPSMLGKTHSEETKKKISLNSKGRFDGEDNPMYGKPCYLNMSDEEKNTWKENIRKGNTGKSRTDEHKKNYSTAASKRKWLVHRNGTITHTMDENDYRLSHPDWQNGKKWKDK